MPGKSFLLPLALLCMYASCVADPAVKAKATAPPSVRVIEDFPFEQTRAHDNDFSSTGTLEQISANLYRYGDCANVYVVKSGSAGLMVDFGSGDIMERLPEIGVQTLEQVLLTHHHRNQAQGLVDLGDYGFKLTAPAAEALYLESAESFWDKVKIHINYDCRSHWNTIRRNIRLDRKVTGGDSL